MRVVGGNALRRMIFVFIPLLLILAGLSCNNNNGNADHYSTDTVVINNGRLLFEQNCASCHSFTANGIGPNLSGVTSVARAEWLTRFIKNPEELLKSGDTRAQSLQQQYKSIMPPFAHLQERELKSILAFIHQHKKSAADSINDLRLGILNPYEKTIPNSGLVAELMPVAKFPVTSQNGEMPLTRITKMDFQPGTHINFVNDLRGRIYKLKANQPSLYLDIRKYFPEFTDAPGLASGLGSFAFHPEFNKNGLFYTTHTETPGATSADFNYPDSVKAAIQWVLTEWKLDNPDADTLAGTHRELLRVDMVAYAHGVQEICFNPLARKGSADFGLLYVGIGDGSAVQESYPPFTGGAHNIWGTIIRIDPSGRNSRNGKYGIPADNPFVKSIVKNAIPEIYAYGFRNPHRITWTRSGMMLACNIGQASIESIYLVKPGYNFGWPVREGNFVLDPYGNLNNIFPLPADDSIHQFQYPVVAFDHDEGSAITGGYEYQGSDVPLFKGKFLFGDITSGRLFYTNVSDIKEGSMAPVGEWHVSVNGKAQTLKEVCGSQRVDLRFGRDAKGEIYIMTKADGVLYKVVSVKQDASLK